MQFRRKKDEKRLFFFFFFFPDLWCLSKFVTSPPASLYSNPNFAPSPCPMEEQWKSPLVWITASAGPDKCTKWLTIRARGGVGEGGWGRRR